MKNTPAWFRIAIAALSLLAWPRAGLAQEAPEAAKPYDLGGLNDTEKVDVSDAIKGYVYMKPPTRDSLKVFDAVKGDVVVLTFKRLVLDKSQGGCATKGANGYLAVCGEFTSPEGETYVLIFVLHRQDAREEVWTDGNMTKRKTLGKMVVRDVIIGSVDGVKRQEWTQDAQGFWHSKPANVVEGDLPADPEPKPAAGADVTKPAAP
jgi:hypothetical protein